MQTRTIQVDQYKVNVYESGEGFPIVLLHGLGGSWEDWENNFAALEANFRVIAIDIPGFGDSSPPPKGEPLTLDNTVAFFHRFLQVLGLHQVILFGNSMGGLIALKYAIDYPQRVAALVLAGSAGIGIEIGSTFRWMSLPFAARFALRNVNRDTIVNIWRSLVYSKELVGDAQVERTWRWFNQPGTKSFLIDLYRHAATLRGQRYVFKDDLNIIQSPVLVTWGANDRVVPPSHAVDAFRLIPISELHIFKHCAHIPMWEVPDEFNQVVMKFLQPWKTSPFRN
jgi:pimeloyl-ACP methyl ester carboxylesterase